ncbi:MAG: HAD-IC family P-type ATPase [Myxococcales bacterium]|nr:HAD-IC family P-type ATPase [Myxococcales bacterium]
MDPAPEAAPTRLGPTHAFAAAKGLDATEVAERVQRGEVNRVRRETSRTIGGIVRANLVNVFNIAIFSMAAVLLALFVTKGDLRTLYDALAISTVALLNSVISIVQEIRAKRALDRISALAQSTATVLRAGVSADLPVDEIVVDDWIELHRGDQVPVDGRVVESHHCEVDESLLTGESEYIFKEVGAELRSGSFCVAGSCRMVAQRVGPKAYIHELARDVKLYKRAITPLQKNIDRIVEVLMGLALLLGLLVVGAAVVDAKGGVELDYLFIETTRSVASIVTSMIPIGLILLSTVAFALGVFRISKQGALVQKLNAIESFANVDAICMDKTGTLTQNQLVLVEVVSLSEAVDPRLWLAAFAHRVCERNATIEALVAGLPDPSEQRREAELQDELPFNSKKKRSAARLAIGGERRSLVLGAPELLAPRCSEAQQARIAGLLAAREGSRNLLFAELVEAGDPSVIAEPLRAALERPDSRLEAWALVSLEDEVRPNVGEVLRRFAERRIDLKIVSGDAPETIRAVARRAGWQSDTSRVVTGPELDTMSVAALEATAREESLFGRVSPQNKRQLVEALQRQGRYVAMIGDGVNDVLALKRAELGIAMHAGNRMSRDVSDIVLLENDFTVLPNVLDEGNTIVSNVQSAAKLFLTKNVYAVLLILFVGFMGLDFPFVPRHVTIIGFFAISIPALFIAFTRRMLDIPPRFLLDVLRFTAISGGLIAVAGTLVYLVAQVAFHASVEVARTAMLSTIVVLSQLNFLVIVGGRHLWLNLRRNALFVALAVAFVALYFTILLIVTRIVALRGLASFLELSRPGWGLLLFSVLLALVAGVALVWIQAALARRDR